MARLTTESYVKIALIVALGAVLIGAVTVGGCSGFRFGFGSNLSQIGDADIEVNNIDSISIDWASGSVDVKVHDGESILIAEYANQGLSRSQQMHWDVKDTTLKIDYGNAVGCSSFGGKRLEIMVPKKLAKEMGSFTINGASGEYGVEGLTCNEFRTDLASGSLQAKGMDISDLRLDLASGNAFVEGRVSNEIKAGVASGNIDIRCLEVCPQEIDADMASGTVVVSIPENEGFTVKVDRISGNFESDFALQQNGDSYTYKDGKAFFKADMASGQFILKKTA